MLDTSARLLRLLSLLQARPQWTGTALADHLGVTTRTVRRDIDRLRTLGYPVDAAPGVGGGYRLGAGGNLPPLLLDDDEAVAVAVALSVSAAAVVGVEQSALAALTKLDRLMPTRLRGRVMAIRSSTVSLAPPGDAVDADVLVALAQACQGHERATITYRPRDREAGERRIEPYRLVATGRRWYLLARDIDRDAWRTYRVDRIDQARLTGHRFVPIELPDVATMVGEAITTAPYRYQALIIVDMPPHELAKRMPPTVGVVAPHPRGAQLTVGSDSLDGMTAHLVALGTGFEVLEPRELREHIATVGARLLPAQQRREFEAEQ